MTNYYRQTLTKEDYRNKEDEIIQGRPDEDICEYCAKENVIVSGGCCEKCNWKLYGDELFETVTAKEIEELKENEKELKDSNPLNSPCLGENYRE